MIYINRFFSKILKKLNELYLNSRLYDKKISKINNQNLIYKPSPHLLSSLIRYQKKKIKIDDFVLSKIWNNKEINNKDFRKLNNFYWLFSLDLKSSKENTQTIIKNWITINHKYSISRGFSRSQKSHF